MRLRSSLVIGILLAAASITLSMSAMALGEEIQPLVSGTSSEHALGPNESHAYTITLKEGEAVLGEADQHGVDLVIDVYGPAGNLIRTVDSPNGTEGPEPIDLSALETGSYKLVIHTLEKTAKPGKYVLKVDRVLTLDENARRMAEKNYPPALLSLWRASLTDSKAVDQFVASRKGKGPIIENPEGDNKNVRVTYLYYGDANTESVRTSGGPHAAVGGIPMKRFLRTPLFFATEIVPNDSRYRYDFSATETRFVGPAGTVQISDEITAPDPLNPEVLAGRSVLAMPAAPAQPYLVESVSVPRGTLAAATVKSAVMNEDRTLTVYQPPGYDGKKACDLLIVFDGETWDGHGPTPTPTILDNLIAGKKIGPTVAVFVNNMGKRNRDMTNYQPFADFIGKELVPWARKNYRIRPGANHVVVAGASFGGLAAGYCAFKHSEAIGNVLSQSGSYFVTKDWQTPPPPPLTGEPGELIGEYRNSKRLPIRFYMEVGRFESAAVMLSSNRELRSVLQLKGYPLTYKEFDGGHDAIWWRGSFADGLISLIGRKGE